MKVLTLLVIFISFLTTNAQEIAILKYNGGGDWYANPTALPNLIKFCNTNIGTTLNEKPEIVEASSPELFQYPFLHMTGHGNVFFSQEDADNLRTYLLGGGFLHIDDNYGMEPYLRKELNKVFPDKELVELSAENAIFEQTYSFPKGLPKIHEHDGKRPQAFGIFHENKLLLLFTFESDLGDGWEDPQVHNDPEEVRLKALQMGANIIQYVFKN
ncbi:DUF4159 domain-containing protein [Cellulophaga sp. E16_2]|uniref:DUF4159 domain-containing protein n=1 Tax=Cellulophaga algicola (strain DSM 14237 / IC166 / ACAM 630) TaxID=688270 RepID=E6X431_CELAD|nr:MULTISPECIES: DUF4159 domain-containing protein [Cellulophaga]ADV50373.1 hypothetical protein Celal_3099 [Cellulophaga algicola DSM 14237]MBO0592777.1 DUF4159 domain-containing protein [Cellulophaga sp. E16_2]